MNLVDEFKRRAIEFLEDVQSDLVKRELRGLQPRERAEVLSWARRTFCSGCGKDIPDCKCFNVALYPADKPHCICSYDESEEMTNHTALCPARWRP